MRVKSDEKRQAIIDVAAQTFQELGFEGASMSEICSRVGGSKATLYNYFASKEDLFFEVMFQSADKEFEAVHDLLTTGLDVLLFVAGVSILIGVGAVLLLWGVVEDFLRRRRRRQRDALLRRIGTMRKVGGGW